MRVMVVGGGGREHAIAAKLSHSPRIKEIFALPGNGGMEKLAKCVNISAKDVQGVMRFALDNRIDYAVVAPDDPLVMGMVDALAAVGIPCFGPDAAAAIIEGSKAFSKRLMAKYGIPTARCEIFDDMDEALAYVRKIGAPLVIKADGLALGKGVVIAGETGEAEAAVVSMMQDGCFGESGRRVVVEEFLEGPEVTVLAFTDGETVVPMPSSMDHKRAFDGDTGKNTGGMGVIAPNPFYTEETAAWCMEHIFLPTVRAMRAEGRPFKGCLYFGLMLTKDGPKVIEYNCRFGDPEAQAVLPLLETDLFEIMQAVTAGRLRETEIKFRDAASCCVVMASRGYPEKYETGFEITLPRTQDHIFIAGARTQQGKLLTSGGRVLCACAVRPTLGGAVDAAYALTRDISFENAFWRNDIGAKALRGEG